MVQDWFKINCCDRYDQHELERAHVVDAIYSHRAGLQEIVLVLKEGGEQLLGHFSVLFRPLAFVELILEQVQDAEERQFAIRVWGFEVFTDVRDVVK